MSLKDPEFYSPSLTSSIVTDVFTVRSLPRARCVPMVLTVVHKSTVISKRILREMDKTSAEQAMV